MKENKDTFPLVYCGPPLPQWNDRLSPIAKKNLALFKKYLQLPSSVQKKTTYVQWRNENQFNPYK